MEKETGTFILSFLGGVAAYVLGRLGVEYVKREIANIDKLEKQSKENLKDAGVDEKCLDNIKTKVNKFEKNAFVKSAFYGVVDNEKLGNDVILFINGEDNSNNNSNLVRVREAVDEKGRKNIEFLLEIPQINPKSGFHLRDYIRCCDRAAFHMWERIVVDSIKPRTRLVGFVGYDRINPDNPEERIAETIQLSSEFTMNYKKNPESTNDGVYDFYRKYNELFKEAEAMNDNNDEIYIEPTEDLLEFLNLSEEDDVRVFEVFLAYKISFPRKFKSPKDGVFQGIDVSKTIKCLEYLIKDFKVFRQTDEEKNSDTEQIETFDRFGNVMFQALDQNDEYSLNHYYTINKKSRDIETSYYAYGIV